MCSVSAKCSPQGFNSKSLLFPRLYGLTTLQTYIYFGRSRNDSVVMKFLVGTLFCFGALDIEMFTSRSAPSGELALSGMKNCH